MISIPLLLLIVFQYIPLYGGIIAFMDYHPLKGISNSEWVGLKHFKEFFSYKQLGQLFRNTIVINMYSILLSPLPMLFALCIKYSPLKCVKNLLHTLSVIPNFLSLVVICELTMRFLAKDGMLNDILSIFGCESTNFLAIPELFPSYYVWSGVFQNLGFSSIVYINALSSVPKINHEAAVMDGASLFKRMVYIDIPSIIPIYGVNLIFQISSVTMLNVEKVLLLQNNINLQYSNVLSTYTYDLMFSSIIPKYSLSMAVSEIMSLISISMFSCAKILTRKWEVTNE